jgi:hypothetical protein
MASADSDASNVQKVVNRSPLLLQSRRPRSPALGVGGRNDGPAAPDPAGGRNRLPDHLSTQPLFGFLFLTLKLSPLL